MMDLKKLTIHSLGLRDQNFLFKFKSFIFKTTQRLKRKLFHANNRKNFLMFDKIFKSFKFKINKQFETQIG